MTGERAEPGGPGKRSKSIMRSLGEFFGHVARGFTAPVKGERRVLRHETREHTEETPRGTVTLRRTVVEEMELRPDEERPAP